VQEQARAVVGPEVAGVLGDVGEEDQGRAVGVESERRERRGRPARVTAGDRGERRDQCAPEQLAGA